MNAPREPNARPAVRGTPDRPRAPLAYSRAGQSEVPSDSDRAQPAPDASGAYDVNAEPPMPLATVDAAEVTAGKPPYGGPDWS